MGSGELGLDGAVCITPVCFSVFKCVAGSLSFNASAVLSIDLRLEH